MLHRFASSDDLHQRPVQPLGDLRPHHDDRAAAIADDAAIKPVQRIGNQRRIEHILDGDDVRQHGVRIVLGMMRRGDLDPGKLRGCGAVIVHVPHGAHGVAVGRGDGIGYLPAGLRLVRIARAWRGAGSHAFATRAPGERDQRHVTLAGGNSLGGVRGQRNVRRAAEFGRLGVAKFQVHIFRHRGGSRSRRVAGAEITVDVVTRQAGVLELLDHRPEQERRRDFAMELCHRLVRRMPRRVLEGAGNVGFTLDGHAAGAFLEGDTISVSSATSNTRTAAFPAGDYRSAQLLG